MVNVWSVKEGEVYGGQYVVSEGIRDLRSTPPSLTEDFDLRTMSRCSHADTVHMCNLSAVCPGQAQQDSRTMVGEKSDIHFRKNNSEDPVILRSGEV